MKTLDMEKATAPLADYARTVGEEPVILTRDGKPVAALVSVENADWETVKLSTDTRFMHTIERSRARQTREGGMSTEEMRRRLGQKKQGDSP